MTLKKYLSSYVDPGHVMKIFVWSCLQNPHIHRLAGCGHFNSKGRGFALAERYNTYNQWIELSKQQLKAAK